MTPPEPIPVNLAETITGADYGKTINYKATVQGQEVSNWKIFLNDGKNVYIILDDYLPVSLVPASAGFITKPATKPYSVWNTTSIATLVGSLTTQSHWSEFANGVEGATATGGPTNAQLVDSWNANPEVNERKLEKETVYNQSSGTNQVISDPTKLYMPHTEIVSNCGGYWLTSLDASNPSLVWYLACTGLRVRSSLLR